MVWWKKTALILSAVGAINWGLKQFEWDLVEKILGTWSAVATVVYYLIAVCGLYALYATFAE